MKEIKCEVEGTLVFKEIKYAGDIITFKDNQELKIEYSKYKGEDFITIEYDFGMTIKQCSSGYEYCGFLDITKDSTVEEIVKRTVTYDLEHSFCHPNEDPNYVAKHWAIKGWLKDRVDIKEDEKYLDLKNSENS